MVDLDRSASLREAIELLYFGYRQFTLGPDRILEKKGLNRVHHRILYFIARQPNRSVKELLKILGISKQALNLPLRQLISMNLVQSIQSDSDGRIRELSLTNEGKQLEKRLTATQTKLLNDVFTESGSVSEEGWRRVMRAMKAFVD